jgi:glycosyltransferase involved in cell wall biosynthesis
MWNNMVKNYPKISIVTPSYNQGNYLEQTLLSVIEQNYPNLEYIVIDGASTDNSVEIIKKYEKYLTYWVSEPDKGLYDALQKGFVRTTGEIMAWINSDDLYYPKALATVAEVFESFPQVQWLSGHPTCIDEYGRIVYISPERKYSKYLYLTQKNTDWIQQESTFWRRTLWEKTNSQLDTSLKLAGDFELWMRFFSVANVHIIPTLLGAFRIRANNQKSLNNYEDYVEEAEKIIEKYANLLTQEEKYRIKKIKFYNTIKPYSLLNSLLHADEKLTWLLDYSPKIQFDRASQNFVLKG